MHLARWRGGADSGDVPSDTRLFDPAHLLHWLRLVGVFEVGFSPKTYFRIIDRRSAIERAIEIASEGDSVLIAGKGHENYQIVGKVKNPFDDREVAREKTKEMVG